MNSLSSVEYLTGPIGNSAINVFWNSSLLFLREKTTQISMLLSCFNLFNRKKTLLKIQVITIANTP